METTAVKIANPDGSMREIARLALAGPLNVEAAKEVLGDHTPEQALEAYHASLAPLADAEPEFNGAGAKAVRDWLKPIGMKIAPSMAPDVCSTWLTAVTMALSDFPAKVIVQAARSAIRIPMQFLNEVDGHVRAEAEKVMERHATALRRLRDLQREIEQALNPPQPKIAAPINDEPLTPRELRALSPQFRELGLKQGWITQEELDAAEAEQAA